jgi:hypothetical protein
MRHKPLFIALIGLLLAASAQAQWKWRDAKGLVQYSDMPPPAGTPDKDILQRPQAPARNVVIQATGQPAPAASAPQPAGSAPTKAEQDAAARQKQDQDKLAAKHKEDEARAADLRRENCGRAQAYMRDLQSGSRLTRTNEQGERVYVDDAQRQTEVERARQAMTESCR